MAEIRQNPSQKIPLDQESWSLFDLARDLFEISEGLLDPGVAPVLEHQGYDAHYRLQTLNSPKPAPSVWTLSDSSDTAWIQSTGPLDLGALGKGYALDQMMLCFQDFDHVMINAGGDILCKGQDLDKGPWRIGLEDPINQDHILGIFDLKSGAFAGSSGEKRRWGKGQHHLINPLSLDQADQCLASFVCAPTAILADALSTLIFIQDKEKSLALQETLSFEFALINKKRELFVSPNFQVQWF